MSNIYDLNLTMDTAERCVLIWEVYWDDLIDGPEANYLFLKEEDAAYCAKDERRLSDGTIVQGHIRTRCVY